MAFIWDDINRRYYDDEGNEIDDAVLREWISAFAVSLAVPFRERAERLQKAIIDLALSAGNATDGFGTDAPDAADVPTPSEAAAEFQQAFFAWANDTANEIYAATLATTLIAFGGQSNATADQFLFAETQAQEQIGFWEQFAAAVAAGGASTAYIAARSEMYAASTYASFANGVRYREGSAGMREERRYLGAADHCTTCLEQAAIGWVAIGSLRRIGDSECKTRCRCYFRFR